MDTTDVEAARRRVAAAPTDPAALFALGSALWQGGDRDAAVDALARAVAVRPDHADARNNLGTALVALGRPAEALAHYRAALAARPQHAATLYNLGNALLAAGEPAEAEAQYRAALAIEPTHAGAQNNRGNALRALGRIEDAEACYRQAVALRPEMAGAHNNLGSALLALHRPEDAVECFAAALRLDANYAEACNNLGGTLLALDRPEEAVAQFRRAVALDAGQAQARFGESLALLALGRFREGWAAYETRWLDPRFREGTREYAAPLWLGAEDIAGRRVLLHCEQGLGDTIQFVRYAGLLRARGAQVLLEVQAPLLKLLQHLADAAVAEGAELPPHDLRTPLLSLPLAFGTEPASIPADIPYLRADPALVAAWADTLGPARGLRVGIAISGSAEHPEDALRSIPAERLLPLLTLPGLECHLVQKDVRPADAEVLRHAPVRLHADRLTDFAQTAALLMHMDITVSVDTSVAHLAGALGRPVWVLVQRNADFRWLRERADSPWYPTMRLFRQAKLLDWTREIAQVAEALRERAAMTG